ncbi:branched-chain amino acid transport system II carrier protein [Alteribacillus bidgolensis]|uniref:Branched-chain amino acid transport system carrier protein n=1 Tax=Alteribacillus bidgolensis TaxID=930129 RepID=A0A1G8L520_9BACI|nr:branched-chain amino acid transport system II carrier protein [Alteribacillus bidgolensis]SDI50768.1 branched-chain amino acid:cation transporter, LIVCS family [Alteribacillus bidgolensis]
MEQLNRKDTLFIGLMLFALFFGAGNLIFPPFLGQEAGTNYWIAILGFVITGVGLPVLGVIAIAINGSSIETITKRVSIRFAIIFTFILYLAIGPFFGIPRAMNVSFEMGAMPFLSDHVYDAALFIYSILFFIVVYWLSLNPSKMVKRIGNIITPILLAAIILLVAGSALSGFVTGGQAPGEGYSTNPLTSGILEGYLTMDAIAALAFGLVIVSSIKEHGINNKQSILKTASIAGIIAGIGLVVVYTAIGWLGVQSAPQQTFENGSQILSYAANQTFGITGTLILGIIVTLACLTTCVGLVTACGQYFHGVFPKVRYHILTLIITIISLAAANLGLNTIISISIPVLVAIYPIAIVLILLSLIEYKASLSKAYFRGAVIGTALISVYDGLRELGIELSLLNHLYSFLPLFELGLGWIWPAAAGIIISRFIRKARVN